MVKGIVFNGAISWKTWHDCPFLDGALSCKAQDCMGQLHPGEIATDAAFKRALTSVGIPTSALPERDFDGETAYVLVTGKAR